MSVRFFSLVNIIWLLILDIPDQYLLTKPMVQV